MKAGDSVNECSSPTAGTLICFRATSVVAVCRHEVPFRDQATGGGETLVSGTLRRAKVYKQDDRASSHNLLEVLHRWGLVLKETQEVQGMLEQEYL